jgi:peptidoglycan/LPS O-acetylase OafA/YrhL
MARQFGPLLKTWLRLLLPSFIADVFYPKHKPTWKLHPTSYLDGLRGVASVLVFFCHYTENNFGELTRWYGINEGIPSGLIQLPYIRLIYSGRPMVHIFFVISGFVLSYKPIKAIHARDMDKCYTALSSSTFRRAFRLFGPCLVSTFFVMCMAQLGYHKVKWPSWSEQFAAWRHAVFAQITWPWAWDTDLRPGYDPHLWTIPIEFAHSMLLFMVILMVSRVRLRIRQAMVVALMGYCLTCGKWAGFEFLAGLFLAEIHVLQNARRPGWESPEKDIKSPRSVLRTLKTVFCISLLLMGFYIGGWPNIDADKTPGIRWLLANTPRPFSEMDKTAPQKFFFGLSAVGIVWAVGELPLIKRFFEGPLAQYCGRISYAIYICHGPVLDFYEKRVCGNPFIPAQGEPGTKGFRAAVLAKGVKGITGMDTRAQMQFGWLLGLCILGPMAVWAADLFWRGVDDMVVKVGRKIELACLDDTEESPQSQGYSTVG